MAILVEELRQLALKQLDIAEEIIDKKLRIEMSLNPFKGSYTITRENIRLEEAIALKPKYLRAGWSSITSIQDGKSLIFAHNFKTSELFAESDNLPKQNLIDQIVEAQRSIKVTE